MMTSTVIALMMTTSGITLPAISEEEVVCLAQNVYHEARNQSDRGQIAVTHVVLNRMESKRYPNTACKVIKQARYRDGQLIRDKCQFSWYCDGRPDVNPDRPRDRQAWEKSLQSALDAYMLYHLGIDVTDGATYYHANYVKPWWRRHFERVAKIGTHIFYKRKDA